MLPQSFRHNLQQQPLITSNNQQQQLNQQQQQQLFVGFKQTEQSQTSQQQSPQSYPHQSPQSYPHPSLTPKHLNSQIQSQNYPQQQRPQQQAADTLNYNLLSSIFSPSRLRNNNTSNNCKNKHYNDDNNNREYDDLMITTLSHPDFSLEVSLMMVSLLVFFFFLKDHLSLVCVGSSRFIKGPASGSFRFTIFLCQS